SRTRRNETLLLCDGVAIQQGIRLCALITSDQVANRWAPVVRDVFLFRNIINGTAYEKETTR
ncbi:MAG TPA: hypothetical protein VGF37_10070, partial [Chthoniobacterales bacterium]